MIDRHLSVEQVQHCRKRTLAPEELADVYAHLDRCASCRAKVKRHVMDQAPFAAFQTDLLLGGWTTPEHLSPQQIADFVDQILDPMDRKMALGHLALCSSCMAAVEQVQAVHEVLSTSPVLEVAPLPMVTLQDLVEKITVESDGTVYLENGARLPQAMARWVSALITTGLVPPARSVRNAWVRSDRAAMPAPLLTVRSGEEPTPLWPACTAIRSPPQTLRWEGVAEAQEYRVVVAHQSDTRHRKVVWRGSAGTQTHLAVPVEIALEAGKVYVWQVIAVVAERSIPSPHVWFSVLAPQALQEVESAERHYAHSALLRASLYGAYRLYEETLEQMRLLAALNPDSDFVQTMQQRLSQQTGREWKAP